MCISKTIIVISALVSYELVRYLGSYYRTMSTGQKITLQDTNMIDSVQALYEVNLPVTALKSQPAVSSATSSLVDYFGTGLA